MGLPAESIVDRLSLMNETNESILNQILQMFAENGGSLYGGEAVTQEEHALQAAHLARQQGADHALVAAALLHDVGHLLHELPDDAPDHGIDDVHEELAAQWLSDHFVPEVVEPVRMHVAAKRYLCAVEPAYLGTLSEPSIQSLKLQGGPMSPEEVDAFRQSPHYDAAVKLRRWDDEAKIAGLEVPPVGDYQKELLASMS